MTPSKGLALWHPCQVMTGQELLVALAIQKSLPPGLEKICPLQRRTIRQTKKGVRLITESLIPGYILLRIQQDKADSLAVFLRDIPRVIGLHPPLNEQDAQQLILLAAFRQEEVTIPMAITPKVGQIIQIPSPWGNRMGVVTQVQKESAVVSLALNGQLSPISGEFPHGLH